MKETNVYVNGCEAAYAVLLDMVAAPLENPALILAAHTERVVSAIICAIQWKSYFKVYCLIHVLFALFVPFVNRVLVHAEVDVAVV